MNDIEIRIPDEAFERVSALLRAVPDGAPRALSNALNRGLTTAQSETTKQIKNIYDLQKTTVRGESITRILRSTPDTLVGEVTFSGHKIPLYNFGVTPRKPTLGEVVSARKRLDSSPKPSSVAFVARMRSGHIGVFERKRSGRFPVSERMGLSVAEMASDSVVRDEVTAAAVDTIDKRVEHEIGRILAGY